ncbi:MULTISPECIES: PH domain-containing protein [Lactiplantibacillus]|jgi:putative membrane protein|nr:MULTISPECIES: PH domain-containing protein [Lactiplantibacillus]MCM8607982.1 PH domain-containing protein [Lactiplantibacillus sp. B652]USJ87519.1 PH domain-containing protein [Lactiplantibacillus pentosus]
MKPNHLSPLALLQFSWQAIQVAFYLDVGIAFLTMKWLKLWERYSTLIVSLMGVMAGGALLLAVIRYWRFTYRLTDGGLTINKGLVNRQVQHIPYRQIQTIQRQQSWFLQPWHLEQLIIETAEKVSEDDLIQLPLVRQTVGDELIAHQRQSQNATASKHGDQSVQSEPATQRLRVSWHDLNVYALSSVNIVLIMGVVAWFGQQVFDVGRGGVWRRMTSLVGQWSVWQISMAVGVVMLVSYACAYAQIMAQYYHFTIERRATVVTVTRGWLQRRQASVALSRIQAVKLQQNWLRQWLHLTTVQVVTASQVGDTEDNDELKLLPVVPQSQALTTVSRFIDWVPTMITNLTSLDRRARWAVIRNCLLLWSSLLLVVGLIVLKIGRQSLSWLLISLPIWVAVAVLQGSYASHWRGAAINSDTILILQTSHFFTRQQWVLPRNQVQALIIKQSWWMRASHSAHLRVSIRDGRHERTITVRYLPTTMVRQIQGWYVPNDKALNVN